MSALRKSIHILLPTLALLAATLGCGLISPPTPTPLPTETPPPTETPLPTETPTPTFTPTPTLPPLPEMDTWNNDAIGISISYPADWEAEPQEAAGMIGAMFSTVEGFDVGGREDGAGLALIAVPLGDLGITDADMDELWDTFAESMAEDADVGLPEDYEIGGTNGRVASLEGTDEDYRGYVAMAIANDYAYVFAAVASPADSWENYEDIFVAMLDSVEFFEPETSAVGEGRDDVPIPPGAEVSLNMEQMVMYQVDESVEDAVQFVEDNWPDYGWVADTGNLLHAPSEGLMVYLKDGEMALIAVSEGEDAGKTDVVALIGPEE